MPRPRKPLTAAKTEGRDKQNKGRYVDRNEYPSDGPLGDPPDYIQNVEGCHARSAWRELEADIPWLTRRDRTLVEMACLIRGEIMAGTPPGIQKMNLLRQCLGMMGATPADATKVGAPSGKDDDDEESREASIFSKGK